MVAQSNSTGVGTMRREDIHKPHRTDMPTVAAWIDDLRQAFGADEINVAIRQGQAGEPAFYAIENGHEIGTKHPGVPFAWQVDGAADRRYFDGCTGECVGTDRVYCERG